MPNLYEAATMLANYLEGTCNNPQAYIENNDLPFSEDELLERIADFSCPIEICPECGWWVELSELVDENCEPTVCDGCKPSEYDKEEERERKNND